MVQDDREKFIESVESNLKYNQEDIIRDIERRIRKKMSTREKIRVLALDFFSIVVMILAIMGLIYFLKNLEGGNYNNLLFIFYEKIYTTRF